MSKAADPKSARQIAVEARGSQSRRCGPCAARFAQGLAVGLGLLLAAVLLGCQPAAPAPATAPPAAPAAPQAAKPAAPSAPAAPAAPAAPSARRAEPARVKAVYTAASGSAWPHWIAQDAGLFAKHGIEAESEFVASSTTAMQAMLAGQVGFITTLSAPTAIQAALGGSDVVIVGAINNTLVFWMMTTPEVQAYADLRGKRLGITRLGSGTDSAARFALAKWGLRPDEDVAIIQMGGVPEILAGLQTGAIQAGVLPSPTDLRARQSGLHELADLGAIGLDYPLSVIATTRTYLRDNEDVVRGFLRATVEAVHLLKTEPDQAKAIFGKWADTTDSAVLDATYRAYFDKTETIPYVKPSAMQSAIDEVAQTEPRAASTKPEDYLDNRYVREMETSGFIRQVWGGDPPR